MSGYIVLVGLIRNIAIVDDYKAEILTHPKLIIEGTAHGNGLLGRKVYFEYVAPEQQVGIGLLQEPDLAVEKQLREYILAAILLSLESAKNLQWQFNPNSIHVACFNVDVNRRIVKHLGEDLQRMLYGRGTHSCTHQRRKRNFSLYLGQKVDLSMWMSSTASTDEFNPVESLDELTDRMLKTGVKYPPQQ